MRNDGTQYGRRKILTASAIVAVALFVGALLTSGWNSAHQSASRGVRVKKLKMLFVALFTYADEHGSIPPARTISDAGDPDQSWRVLLLPYLDEESLYSRIDLNQRWDSPKNRRSLATMPEYYRSPRDTARHGTSTDYFAVVGRHAPWWSAKGGKPREVGGRNEALLIELTGLERAWMEPWDPTLEEVLDVLRPEGCNNENCGADIMYVTVDGDVRTIDPKCNRESIRQLLLGSTSEPK